MGQSEAHHRAAHDETRQLFIGFVAKLIEQCLDWRAEQCPNVTWFTETITGECHYTADQRFTMYNRARNRLKRADILHHQTDIGRNTAFRYFQVSQDFDELFLTTRRVFGRDNADHYWFVLRGLLQRCNGFRFVIFNPDDGEFWF